MRNHLIAWIIFVLILGAGAVFVLNNYGNDEQATNNSEPAANNQTEEPVTEEDNKDVTDLDSVRDTNENGVAERSYEDGVFTFEVVANLNPPAEGKFYEGWVVGDGRVISTGELKLNNSGAYTQIFEVEEDLTAQKLVVITEETLANGLDNKPEAHVIEGSF